MGLSPPIMNDILTSDQNASYNLRFGVTVATTMNKIFDTNSSFHVK